MEQAARLFAQRGYRAVPLQNIALAVGIKAPSIYNHYAGKEELIQQMYAGCSYRLRRNYMALAAKNKAADSIEQIFKNVFYTLQQERDPFIQQVLCVSYAECYSNAVARRLYCQSFYTTGIQVFEQEMSAAVQRGLVDNFSISTLATLLMDSVAMGCRFYMEEDAGTLARRALWYGELCDFFIRLAKANI